jgi:4'-phosphopantetheinyl transferase EntD
MLAFGTASLSTEQCSPLTAAELALADRQVTERRRAEIVAGRVAARRALRRLGARPRPVLQHNRAPDFGAGMVGSLTHSGDLALAVVARSDDLGAVGVDVETEGPPPDGAIRFLCRGDELAAAPAVGTAARNRWLLALFSAKESLYKAVSQLNGSSLHPLDVQCLPTAYGFTAAWRRSAPSCPAGSTGAPVYVQWFPGGVCSVVALPHPHHTGCRTDPFDPRPALRAVLPATRAGSR